MDFGTAIKYTPPTMLAEFGERLETYVADKKPDTQKPLEETLMVMMQKLPECVYTPYVHLYKLIQHQ